MEKLGDAIREARRNLHMTLKETGDLLGCSASMVSKYESGLKPSGSMKKIIVDKLGIEDLGDEYIVSSVPEITRLRIAVKSLYKKCKDKGMSWREYASKNVLKEYTMTEELAIFATLAYLIDGDVISTYNETMDMYVEEIPIGLIEDVSTTEQKTAGTDEREQGTEKEDISDLFGEQFVEIEDD